MLSNLLSHIELADMSESDSVNESSRYKAGLLLQACEDWPEFGVVEPTSFINALRAEVGKELTYTNIKSHVESIEIKGDVWKCTALGSVLEMFREGSDFQEKLELQSLVFAMTKSYRKSA